MSSGISLLRATSTRKRPSSSNTGTAPTPASAHRPASRTKSAVDRKIKPPLRTPSLTESHSISFRQIHLEDGGRVRYRKVCEVEDRELTQDEIGKGYEASDGSIIPACDSATSSSI